VDYLTFSHSSTIALGIVFIRFAHKI